MNIKRIIKILYICLILFGIFVISCKSISQCNRQLFIAIDYGIDFPVNVTRMTTDNQGVVVSCNSDATVEGIIILKEGGNATAASAATLLALSVKTLGAFCIGGLIGKTIVR